MAVVNQSIEHKHPGDKVTGRATAAITAKRLVKYTAAMSSGTDGHVKVAHAGANENANYLAREDAANGADVALVSRGLWTATAGAAIVAPALLKVAANGKVVTATAGSIVVGTALTDAAADNDDIIMDLRLPGALVI